MDVLNPGLFPLARLRTTELERIAYITNDPLLTALIAENEDLDDEMDEAESQAEQDQAVIEGLQDQRERLREDLQIAIKWVNSDKFNSIEKCREMFRRFTALHQLKGAS